MAVARAPHTTAQDPADRTRTRRPMLLLALAAVLAGSLLTGCLSSNQVKTMGQMNTDRNVHGLRSLPNLTQASSKAQAWAEHLASIGTLQHTSLASGYSIRWCGLGENVGYGPDTATIERTFMNSPGHRANILNSGWTHAGTGVARSGGRVYVVQEFVKTC